jgi:hypothetical protein
MPASVMRPRTPLFLALTAAVAACGSRTGLLVSEHQDASVADAPEDVIDSSLPEVAEEPDVVEEPDVLDAPEEPDNFIPIDAPDECPDAGSTLIYVITSDNELMSFYPPTGSFNTIGTIQCNDPNAMAAPFSMAVSRSGIAYVVFTNGGNLYRVSTKTAACQKTPFVPGNGGFPAQFGMGFSADVSDAGPIGDGGETLYLAGDPGTMIGQAPVILGALDTSTFATRTIGQVAPTIYASELTGTGAGQLFGFYLTTAAMGAAAGNIGQIDKSTATVTNQVTPPGIDIGGGWAFAFWGGDFYTFTAPNGTTLVQRYRPSDGSVVTVSSLAGEVVGAGVSTCAPQM